MAQRLDEGDEGGCRLGQNWAKGHCEMETGPDGGAGPKEFFRKNQQKKRVGCSRGLGQILNWASVLIF
jgi:hypothetical protein